jgi:ATP phosphoribosyltransferase
LRWFSVFPLWGAAEVYPPENADLALIAGRMGKEVFNDDLIPVRKLFNFSAFLIANKNSWETKDMAEVLSLIGDNLTASKEYTYPTNAEKSQKEGQYTYRNITEDMVRLALPDGHQQSPTIELLNKAGIQVDDYPSANDNRRPATALEGVVIKVVRPQDMPLQVANGNFDLAITGKDWLLEHLYQFPSSPVKELVDLKFGKVKIVAVVSKDLPVNDVYSYRQLGTERLTPFRVASEYVNITDKYARENRLGRYRIVPTWGASEAFLPEDADLLIENTQTGRTIARHNLKIIDTLFESTACLIGNTNRVSNPLKNERIKSIIETIRTAVEGI